MRMTEKGHHLIVTHEVTNQGHDSSHLAPMALKAQEATGTLDKVRTEMSLHVLAYNIKRVIAIIGVGPLMAAIRT
jgi:hypothetical protein